jgi:hypothetical protein
MRKTAIDKLIDKINKANKDCAYPQIGHMRYANITGDGRNYRTVYVIVNEGGGVRAVHNGRTDRETAANLRSILAALKEKA